MNVGFVHGSEGGTGTVTLVRTTSGTPDSEGRVPKVLSNNDVPSCRLAILSSREQIRESRPGMDIDACLLVPLGLAVDDGDKIVAADIDPYLNGDWQVQTIRHAVVHLRVLLKRRGS